MKNLILVACTTATLGIVGCTSASNVYEASPGIYTVTATGDGYSTADRVHNAAFEKAQSHCQQMSKKLHVISEDQFSTRMGIDTTKQLKFRCS